MFLILYIPLSLWGITVKSPGIYIHLNVLIYSPLKNERTNELKEVYQILQLAETDDLNTKTFRGDGCICHLDS